MNKTNIVIIYTLCPKKFLPLNERLITFFLATWSMQFFSGRNLSLCVFDLRSIKKIAWKLTTQCIFRKKLQKFHSTRMTGGTRPPRRALKSNDELSCRYFLTDLAHNVRVSIEIKCIVVVTLISWYRISSVWKPPRPPGLPVKWAQTDSTETTRQVFLVKAWTKWWLIQTRTGHFIPIDTLKILAKSVKK